MKCLNVIDRFRIFIQSHPPGAPVTIDGVPSGTTPARIKIDSLKHSKQVVLEMEEQHDAQLELIPTSQRLEAKAINGNTTGILKDIRRSFVFNMRKKVLSLLHSWFLPKIMRPAVYLGQQPAGN